MTEGVDEHQINLLNANTHGMIRQRVGQLQRQTSFKRSQLCSPDTPTLPGLMGRQMSTDSSDPSGMGMISNRKTNFFGCEEEKQNKPEYNMSDLRRATSYCPQLTHATSDCESASDVTELLIGRTTNVTGKHRRLLQAKQAWFKYQVSETCTTADSFKQRRTKQTAKKLLARGGPHDKEFFKCFHLYLEEALK